MGGSKVRLKRTILQQMGRQTAPATAIPPEPLPHNICAHCKARAWQPADQGCAAAIAVIVPVVPVLQDVYLSARENNWGVHYRPGSWFLTYDL
jgi:hypothetical protein